MKVDNIKIDITYNFSEDYKNGIDPDKYNKILRNWHKLLWVKKLPYKNDIFLLEEKGYGLYHKSDLGEYWLSSDAIIHTFSTQKTIPKIIDSFSKNEIESFFHIACTIGAYILFPGWQVERKSTINVARGLHPRIADRFDLTLECVRLYYNGILDKKLNPLGDAIYRYDSFFKLFTDFKGYCEFFLLHDLTIDNYNQVNFFIPFTGFISKPRPSSVAEYRIYMNNSINFVINRNERIKEFCKENI